MIMMDIDYEEHSVRSPAAAAATSDLRFLSNIERLRHYPANLRAKGYAVTSIRNMLINVRFFFYHVQHCFMAQKNRLSNSNIELVQ